MKQTSLAPGISKIDLGLSSEIYEEYAESWTMIDPFALANSTSRSNCGRDAAVPVGLLGEQKKMTSVCGVVVRSGKKSFSGQLLMYTMFWYFRVSSWNFPAWPTIMLESTYACHGWHGFLSTFDSLVHVRRFFNFSFTMYVLYDINFSCYRIIVVITGKVGSCTAIVTSDPRSICRRKLRSSGFSSNVNSAFHWPLKKKKK